MRQGRPGGPLDERPTAIPIDDDTRHDVRNDGRHDGIADDDEDGRLGQIEDWILLADRRMERLDGKIDRLGAAIDELNGQLGKLLAEMPTRRGINLYLVGGLIGGLAVGLAIMGITIGGFVGGLSSLRPEMGRSLAPAAYPAQPQQAPIIIQMPPGALSGTSLPALPAVVPAAPAAPAPAK